jgi:hypothetical protein
MKEAATVTAVMLALLGVGFERVRVPLARVWAQGQTAERAVGGPVIFGGDINTTDGTGVAYTGRADSVLFSGQIPASYRGNVTISFTDTKLTIKADELAKDNNGDVLLSGNVRVVVDGRLSN